MAYLKKFSNGCYKKRIELGIHILNFRYKDTKSAKVFLLNYSSVILADEKKPADILRKRFFHLTKVSVALH